MRVFRSNTVVLTPAAASVIAAESPFGPDPITVAVGIPLLVMQASLAGPWVPWYDILLFFLRVGLTKIWELGTDPIAIRGSAVLDGPVCRQCKHHILNIITQGPPIESREIKYSCRT